MCCTASPLSRSRVATAQTWSQGIDLILPQTSGSQPDIPSPTDACEACVSFPCDDFKEPAGCSSFRDYRSTLVVRLAQPDQSLQPELGAVLPLKARMRISRSFQISARIIFKQHVYRFPRHYQISVGRTRPAWLTHSRDRLPNRVVLTNFSPDPRCRSGWLLSVVSTTAKAVNPLRRHQISSLKELREWRSRASSSPDAPALVSGGMDRR